MPFPSLRSGVLYLPGAWVMTRQPATAQNLIAPSTHTIRELKASAAKVSQSTKRL